jgi:outer membrane immunogenic protein
MNFALKAFLATSAIFVACGGAAVAQDGPAPVWSGYYAGPYGGSATGTSKGTLSHDDPTTPGVTAASIFGTADQSFSVTGGTGALALGYNHQVGMFVIGVEADMAWVGAEAASRTVVSTDTLTTWRLDTKLYSLGTLRGRAGIATGPVLWYGTAGLAWGLVETDNAVSCVGCAFDPWSQGTSRSVSHLGFIGGGGAELMIGEHFVLRDEYLFADLGAVKHTFTGTSHAGTVPDTANPGCSSTIGTASARTCSSRCGASAGASFRHPRAERSSPTSSSRID